MATIFLKDYRGSSISVFCLNGTTANQLGGSLRRETSTGDGGQVDQRHENNQVVQIENEVFAVHASSTTTYRIYQFNGDAFSADISGLSGLFTRGETVIGLTSSATATMVDSSISGDDFLIVENINGTFSVSETLLGLTSSATATLDSVFAQGGAIGFEGEWFVDYTSPTTIKSTLSFSGLYAIQDEGSAIKISGLFMTSGNQWRAVNYNGSEWIETGDLASTRSANSNELGKGAIIGTSIFNSYESADSSAAFTYYVTYNASTNIAAIGRLNTTTSAGDERLFGNNIVEWNGRVITAATIVANCVSLMAYDQYFWKEILRLTGGGGGGTTEFKCEQEGGVQFFIVRNSLYLFVLADLNGGGGGDGWGVYKFTDKNGVITCDNVDQSATINNTDSPKLSQFILPTSLSLGNASLTNDDVRWRAFIDQQTNDPDGTPIQQAYHVGNPEGGTTDIFTWDGVEDISDQPGVTYTWDGTTTVTYSSGGTVVQADDWIGLKSDEQLFRVLDTSGGNITIENPGDITIPSGSGTSEILLPFSSVGVNLAIAEMAFSENIPRGGGERIFIKGELDVAITGISPNSAGQLISFIAYSPNGSTTVNAEFFYGPDQLRPADTACTISDASAGTIVGTEIQGLTADNSTVYTVTWLTGSDSVSPGENRLVLPKLSTT